MLASSCFFPPSVLAPAFPVPVILPAPPAPGLKKGARPQAVLLSSGWNPGTCACAFASAPVSPLRRRTPDLKAERRGKLTTGLSGPSHAARSRHHSRSLRRRILPLREDPHRRLSLTCWMAEPASRSICLPPPGEQHWKTKGGTRNPALFSAARPCRMQPSPAAQQSGGERSRRNSLPFSPVMD